MLIECVNAGRIGSDFPRLVNFIELCGFGDQEVMTEPSGPALLRIARLGFGAKILLLKDGEIGRRWPHLGDSCGACQYKFEDGEWKCDVAVSVYDEPNNLATGILLGQLGHYIEKVASCGAWLNGAHSLRGNSFDAAVGYLSKVSGKRVYGSDVLDAANGLISHINGAWVARASGTNPMLVASSFLGLVASDGDGPLMDALEKDAKELAEIFTGQAYKGWSGNEWSDEVSMCRDMDSMTGALLTGLYKKVRTL